MIKIECIGMVGKFPTPEGLVMFYDTGRSIELGDLAELMAKRSSLIEAGPGSIKEAGEGIFELAIEIANKTDVYPAGYAAVAEDGRILVTEPWFESNAEHIVENKRELPKWLLDSIPEGLYCDQCPCNHFDRKALESTCSATGRVVKRVFRIEKDARCPKKEVTN